MSTLLILIFIALLLLLSAVFSGLSIGIMMLNRHELKSKAQQGNQAAKIVYPIRALGRQLMVTLLIGNVIANAGIIALLDLRINGLVAVALTTIIVVMFGEILPMAYFYKHSLKLTAKLAPGLKYLIVILSPVARPLGRVLDKRIGNEESSIYTKKELQKILEDYKPSQYSDIEEDEIQIVRHALSFGDKQVREIMTPRRVVVTVSADEAIGPILIDELHKSGHSRFPVFNDEKSQNFIGTLYLHDLIGKQDGGTVKKKMHPEVYYVHEEQPLDHALKAFLKTNHHLLVVVNTFEEFVGVVSFEDVMEEIIGKQIVDEFDQHADLRAVAKSLADKDQKDREAKVENK